MTREELMVIAAAAAVFVLINIIMWTIIAKIEKRRKNKERKAAVDKKTSIPEASAFKQKVSGTTDGGSSAVQTETSANVKKTSKVSKEPRKDFILIDDIVITHTDEII